MLIKIKAWYRRTFTSRRRRYIYRVINASLAAAVAYGVLDGHKEDAILLVVNAALGMADAHASGA